MRRLAVVALLIAIAIVAGLTLAFWAPPGGRPSGARRDRMRASPHWKDGAFTTLIPTHTLLPGTVWKTFRRELAGSEGQAPSGGTPFVRLTRDDLAAPPPSGLRATWMGHATVLVEIDGARVLTDPIWSDRCSPSQRLGPRRFLHPTPITLDELTPEEAVALHEAVRGTLLLPVHWATFDLAYHPWAEPADRLVAAATRRVRFVVPRPGQMVTPSNPPALERWWAGR